MLKGETRLPRCRLFFPVNREMSSFYSVLTWSKPPLSTGVLFFTNSPKGGVVLSKQREEKAAAVEAIKESLKNAQGSVLTDYRGLTVSEMNELRKKLREADVEFRVVKNTLTWRAAQQLDLENLQPYLEGPTAIAFGHTDPVAPAKIISEFAKSHKALEIKAGILEGKVIPLEKVKALADLPSKEQLLGQVASAMQAPISGLVNVLQAPIRNLAYAVDALRAQREKEA